MCARGPQSLVVVTPCSASKRHRVVNAPGFEDLIDEERRAEAFSRFAHLALPARNMYTGQHHQSVLNSVERLRHAWPSSRIDVVIVSAGYGILDESDMIIPYDATFADLSRVAARERGRRLQIRKKLERRLAACEVGVLLLGDAYLRALEPPLGRARYEVYFASPSVCMTGPGIVQIPAGQEESRRLGVAPRMVRAVLFERFARAALEQGLWQAIEWARRPDQLLSHSESPKQLSFCLR